jgi:hypothetical protein
MSEETEKAGRYRLFAARLRAFAAEDATREKRNLLHHVANDFEEMARELEAMDELRRSISKAIPRALISN